MMWSDRTIRSSIIIHRSSMNQTAAAPGIDGSPPAAASAASAASASRLMRSFSSLPGLKYGTFFGGTSTLSPVFGLRPFRGSRFRRRKLPNPRSSIFSPRCSASMMLLKTVSTMTSECFFVRSETRETSSTSSALVMLPAPFPLPLPIVTACSLRGLGCQAQGLRAVSPIPEVVPQRRRAGTLVLLVRLPVTAELVVLHRANAQADFPLLRAQLDDLHLIGVADLQIDLLAAALRNTLIVELGHVDQPFDPLVELDEGAEVGHPGHLPLDHRADVVPGEEVVPDIGRQLLQTQRQALVVGVDAEHHGLDDVALLEDFRRMLDPLAP